MEDRGKKVGFQRRGYTKFMNWYREHNIYLPLLNETARAAMRTKLAMDRLRVRNYCAGRQEEIDAWFERTRLFFGFSSIRCGTVFLSNLLQIELPRAHVEHEANLDDYWHMPLVIQNQDSALDYVRDFRRNEIYFRANHDIDVYGEVNPMLRMHCHAFKAIFPGAKLFQIVRDPRNVIRSIMGKENLGRKDPMLAVRYPPPGDPCRERWARMSRFERVCWGWQFDNRHMRRYLDHRVRFELMVSDYDYFRENVVEFLDVDLSEETWQRYVNRPRNASRRHRMPHWREWDSALLDTLDRICGEEMANYGYSV